MVLSRVLRSQYTTLRCVVSQCVELRYEPSLLRLRIARVVCVLGPYSSIRYLEWL